VGVDHRRLDVFVSEEFLDGSDVVPGHQEMGREGVAECVAADSLGDSCIADGLFDRSVDHGVVEMMAADGVGSGIGAAGTGGEDVLPAPVAGYDKPRDSGCGARFSLAVDDSVVWSCS
jgi:hypothetical protein